jgi:hypothetical protein
MAPTSRGTTHTRHGAWCVFLWKEKKPTTRGTAQHRWRLTDGGTKRHHEPHIHRPRHNQCRAHLTGWKRTASTGETTCNILEWKTEVQLSLGSSSLPSLAPISIGNMSLWRKKRKRPNKHQNKIRSKTNIVDEQHKCYPNNTSWAIY